MGRIRFPKGKQRKWINSVLKKTKLNIAEIAKDCGISARTLRDWKREKFTISENFLFRIKKKYMVSAPKGIKKLSDYWYVDKGKQIGALRRLELYGPPGTPEGRRKGGLVSQKKRRENPEKYRLLGCRIRKSFPFLRPSYLLAEVVGIIIGDGGVTNNQLRISLDWKRDREYAYFVRDIFKKVLGDTPSLCVRKNKNAVDLIISGVNLIENLEKIGIGKGDKIRRQVNLPDWIWKKKEYQIGCVRGLIDTDGGLYFHNHWVKGIRYRNLGLCFTSWSKPLLNSVSVILKGFAVKHSVVDEQRIYVYSLFEIKKYFKIFNTSNPKHSQKLKYHETHSSVLER